MATVKQQTIATIIALLLITEIILHFCWEVVDQYFFKNFTVTAQIALISVILLVVVLFFREELFLDLGGVGSGKGRNRKSRKGGVRNGTKKSRASRKK